MRRDFRAVVGATRCCAPWWTSAARTSPARPARPTRSRAAAPAGSRPRPPPTPSPTSLRLAAEHDLDGGAPRRRHEDRLGYAAARRRHAARHRPAGRHLAPPAGRVQSPRWARAPRCGRCRPPWPCAASGSPSTRRRPAPRSAACSPPTSPARCGTATAPPASRSRGQLRGPPVAAGAARRRRRARSARRLAGRLCGSQGAARACSSRRRLRAAAAARRAGLGDPPGVDPLQVHDLVGGHLAAERRPGRRSRSTCRPPTSPADGAVASTRAGPATARRSRRWRCCSEGGPVRRRASAAGPARGRAARRHSAATPSVTGSRARRGGGGTRSAPDDVALRLTVASADLHAAVYALRDAAGGAVPVRGSAGVGTVHAVLSGRPSRTGGRHPGRSGGAARPGGRCVVVAAPARCAGGRRVSWWAAASPRGAGARLDRHRPAAPARTWRLTRQPRLGPVARRR